jgi:hypothetical protein
MSPPFSRFSTLCLTTLLALVALAGMISCLAWAGRATAMQSTTFIVNNVNDSGPGSLCQALT